MSVATCHKLIRARCQPQGPGWDPAAPTVLLPERPRRVWRGALRAQGRARIPGRGGTWARRRWEGGVRPGRAHPGGRTGLRLSRRPLDHRAQSWEVCCLPSISRFSGPWAALQQALCEEQGQNFPAARSCVFASQMPLPVLLPREGSPRATGAGEGGSAHQLGLGLLLRQQSPQRGPPRISVRVTRRAGQGQAASVPGRSVCRLRHAPALPPPSTFLRLLLLWVPEDQPFKNHRPHQMTPRQLALISGTHRPFQKRLGPQTQSGLCFPLSPMSTYAQWTLTGHFLLQRVSVHLCVPAWVRRMM